MKKRFSVIKPYKHILRFKVVEDSPIRRIKELWKKLKRQRKREKGEKKEQHKVNVNLYIVGAAVVTMLTIFAFLILSITLPFQIVERGGWQGTVKWFPVNFGSVFDKTNGIYLSISEKLSAGNVSLWYTTDGIKLSGKALLVVGPTYNVLGLEDLYNEIEASLRELGFSVERIGVGGLERAGEGDLIVMATGKPPKGSVEAFLRAVEKGAFAIYIGDTPTEEVDEEGELRSVKELWGEAGITFDKVEPPIKEGWGLDKGLFSLGRGSYFQGSMPWAKVGEGRILFLPNYPDLGWTDYKAVAKDVVKVLTSEEVVGRSKEKIDESTTILSVGPNRDLWAKLVVEDGKGVVALKAVRAVVGNNYLYYHDRPIIAPTAIVSKPLNLNLLIQDMPPGMDRDKVKVAVGDKLVELGEVQRGAESVFSLKEDFSKGTYLLKVVGEKGGIYTLAGLIVSGIDADLYPDFDKNTLRIVFKSGGAPQRLDSVRITIKGKTLTFENVKEVEINLAELLGDVPVGTYEVVIESGGEKVVKTFTKKPSTGIGRLLNTTNLVILLLSFLIYMAGLVFAKKEEEYYSIVVPEVIQLKGREVKVKKADILKLFDKVNEFYKWKYMPLTPKEIVNGLKNGLLGEKIVTSEYNVRYILDRLAEKGLVVERLGYYLPTHWRRKSGFPATILALFRKVRDIAIAKIIPFTTRISPSQPYHMKLKLLWQDVYVYFYTGREDLKYIMKHAPAYTKKGLVFIVVPNEEIKEDFLDAIKGPGRGQKALALALKTHSLFVMTIDEFQRKIEELKGR